MNGSQTHSAAPAGKSNRRSCIRWTPTEIWNTMWSIHSDICEKGIYCRDELCNTENGRMIVELYLGKQKHHVSRILY